MKTKRYYRNFLCDYQLQLSRRAEDLDDERGEAIAKSLLEVLASNIVLGHEREVDALGEMSRDGYGLEAFHPEMNGGEGNVIAIGGEIDDLI